tara:strand:- start:53363 stop:54421 length:1059 start_codon:yes stop_codon:yes gene_type:complete
MRRFSIHQSVRSTRSGFTIVELLMVVGILLFLISTSAFLVRNIGNKAREKATMATITKVNGILSQRIESLKKYQESRSGQQLTLSRIKSKRGQLITELGDKKYYTLTDPIVEILVKKDLFRENLPQFLGDNREINIAMGAAAGLPGSDGGLSVSSEYLYFILTQYNVHGIAPVGEDAFIASEVKDTDGDGLKEFVDGWGRPLRFYRWPTRVINPYGSGFRRDLASTFFSSLPPQQSNGSNERDPLNIDPDDPLGRLANENDHSSGLVGNLFNHTSYYYFDSADPLSLFPCEYGTMDTYWLPLIVSAGEDGILGLYEPHDVTNNGVLGQPIAVPAVEGVYDNITNHNQRAGGR